MTSNIRKALFRSLMAQSIENDNVVVLDNGEEVGSQHTVCLLYMSIVLVDYVQTSRL